MGFNYPPGDPRNDRPNFVIRDPIYFFSGLIAFGIITIWLLTKRVP